MRWRISYSEMDSSFTVAAIPSVNSGLSGALVSSEVKGSPSCTLASWVASVDDTGAAWEAEDVSCASGVPALGGASAATVGGASAAAVGGASEVGAPAGTIADGAAPTGTAAVAALPGGVRAGASV